LMFFIHNLGDGNIIIIKNKGAFSSERPGPIFFRPESMSILT